MINREWFQFLGFLSTPPLWEDSDHFKLKQFSLPQINFSESPDFSRELPSLQTNYVLGKRIEEFYSLVLERSPDHQILAQSMQIFKEKITLGELDFILKASVEERTIHLEVVYKFYIYDPTQQEELERWIGPNRKDAFLKKLLKLEEKQLPLIEREESARALEDLQVDIKDIKQEVSFLAHLFIPRHLKDRVFPYVNNKCITGIWIPFKEFSYEDFGSNKYFIPVKQDWPIDPAQNEIWYSFQEILPAIKEIIESERSPLIWMITPSNVRERLFIVWW